MVPNIALDNTVQKHIDALGESGVAGWQEGGDKWLEWNHRKESVAHMVVLRRLGLTHQYVQAVED